MAMDSWIGVDLDGTLAHYDGFRGIEYIGEPLGPMVQRVQQMLARGQTVKIFTARVAESPEAEIYIQDWLSEIGLPRLEVTNIKDFGMIALYDDRAVQVIQNDGRLVVDVGDDQ